MVNEVYSQFFYLGRLVISLKQFKEMLLKDSVSCNLVLANVGGLPYSGKSLLVRAVLQEALINVTKGDNVLDTHQVCPVTK